MKEIEAFKTPNIDRLELLRFKASIDRGIRLAATFTEDIESTF